MDLLEMDILEAIHLLLLCLLRTVAIWKKSTTKTKELCSIYYSMECSYAKHNSLDYYLCRGRKYRE